VPTVEIEDDWKDGELLKIFEADTASVAKTTCCASSIFTLVPPAGLVEVVVN
jgi:hypothetical protein